MIHTAHAILTGQGGRRINEDWAGVTELPGGGLTAVVADGLGGHEGGQIASETAGKEFLRFLSSAALCPDAALLEKAAFRANEAVLDLQTQEYRMMSTLAGFMLTDRQARWVHVGDSRIYHFHNGILSGRTLDHSVSQMAVAMGMIDESQIRFHEDRSRLLRALGSDTFEPEVSGPVPLDRGYHSFLLCSDGFWEYVMEEEMEAALASCGTPGEWLSRMEKLLRERASANSDNYTAAAIFALDRP
ncbi:MAG TPA: serine/threonine-protein phosphatase [Candidatus Limivivens intestinipullorum]|uniref:Serine/threonine-protein phosphatase n=1 Tax=Candidatus Limivivens intestinipullorum TaxID=2840858 RepID=A0A9D1JIM5_9FIRM|nr:serine/threonine-protein phosphatase [Candidatus Limivivens intestinipullorum]